jgi:iturin family lipopeptide synthetase B
MPLLVLIKDPSIINRGLAHSLGGLIDKHEILRTRYVLDNGALMQVILPPGSLSIETTELSHEISLGESIGQYVKPFDLTKEGVYRLRILHRGNEFYLFFDIHHIAADGVSFEILISDLYQLLKGQKTIEPKLTYKDYCEWLVSAEGTALVDIQEQFWLKELKDYQETSPLPYDRPEKRTLNFKGNRLKVELGAGILPSVRQLLKTNNITMYMFLTAVYGSFLYKWSGRRNNLIGSPIAGRISNDLLDVVGLFANTVIVKTVIEDNDNFLDLLYKTKQKLLQVYDNQLFPFERLVDSFKVKRTFGRNPFFDTCLVSKEVKLGTSINNNPWFETIEMTNGTSKFDLSLICVETEDKVSITFEYNKELFKQSTISKFSASFIAFVEHLLQSPAAPMQSVLASFKIN